MRDGREEEVPVKAQSRWEWVCGSAVLFFSVSLSLSLEALLGPCALASTGRRYRRSTKVRAGLVKTSVLVGSNGVGGRLRGLVVGRPGV